MTEGNDTDSNLKCTLCSLNYAEPRLLPCYHIFCTACLEELVTDSNHISCPLCRTKINLPGGGIKGFENYPFQTEFLNKKPHEHRGCHLCSEESFAIGKCMECQMNLCSNCRNYHGKIKALQSHTIELFNNLNPERIVRDETTLEKDCDEHKLVLSQFCKSCNRLICTNCLERYHQSHKTETLISSAKLKRDMLITRIASLKSRIPIIENTIEVATAKGSNNYKSCNQVKKEIHSHAAGLKEVFCRTVDVLLKKTVDRVDDISKSDLKCIQTYVDELEKEKLSLLCFTTTVANLITQYSDRDILQHYMDLGKNLDKVLEKKMTGLTGIHDLHYECGNCNENLIKSMFGKIKENTMSDAIVPSFHFLPVPALQPIAQKIYSFENRNEILDIASDNAGVLIMTKFYLSLHKSDGSLIKQEELPMPDVQLLLRRSRNEIWFWTGNKAIQKNTRNEGFKVSFEGGKCGCFINNGNLIMFNPNETLLYEITEQEGVKGTIGGEDLQILLTNDVMFMTETKDLRLGIAQNDRIIIIEQDGKIRGTFKQEDCVFSSICTDNYGNIIILDQSLPDVSVFSEKACFLYPLITEAEIKIQIPSHTIIDTIGNLWLAGNGKTVEIYSYL